MIDIEALSALYELDEIDRTILETVAEHQRIDAELTALATAEGLTQKTRDGMKLHPAVAEARRHRVEASRLLASIVPDEQDSGGGDLTMHDARSDWARKAAGARWGH
ncbi:hypothetical protein ACT1U9_01945 [Streptomyces sp. BR1]|uniref:hypothetical protein n=1 Tax=Streptomyces sp. BR1 TaxID=1592323 RepID=UPI00402B7F6F